MSRECIVNKHGESSPPKPHALYSLLTLTAKRCALLDLRSHKVQAAQPAVNRFAPLQSPGLRFKFDPSGSLDPCSMNMRLNPCNNPLRSPHTRSVKLRFKSGNFSGARAHYLTLLFYKRPTKCKWLNSVISAARRSIISKLQACNSHIILFFTKFEYNYSY